MGTLKKSAYTIPLPKNATIKNGVVSWTVKGKKKTGKLFQRQNFTGTANFLIKTKQ